MKKETFIAQINAPREKVWQVLWDDASYRKWTNAFAEGSYAKTDNWKEGSKVLFLGPAEHNNDNGMVALIETNRPNEVMSFRHIGEIKNGVEDTESPAVKAWAGAEESYYLRTVDGGTELRVEMDLNDEWRDYFMKAWPEALQKIKELAE